MMPVEPGSLYANVLIYALDVSSPHNGASRPLLDAARSPAATLYVTSQVLCESVREEVEHDSDQRRER